MKMRKAVMTTVLAIALGAGFLMAFTAMADEKIPIKVLLLPKFEIGELTGDFPGEGQLYYEEYLEGGDEYEIPFGYGESRMYVKDGVALYVTGMGKVNAALSTMAVLGDSRFDFSDAYIISTGCAGSAKGSTVMGDVFIITAAVDYDLGHHADPREMENEQAQTWFHDDDYDDVALVTLDSGLTDRAYDLVKDISLETTPNTQKYMMASFEGEEWAARTPKVLKGTTVSGDNYWKGEYDHQNALLMVETYGCADPYALTEMEDVAIGAALSRMGMVDRYLIVRDSVNIDVFMKNTSPERLWASDNAVSSEDEESAERVDIFAVAMENNFKVGRVIVESILNGEL